MKKLSNHFGRNIFRKLSLKSSRSAPVISNDQNEKLKENSKSIEKTILSRKTISSLSNIKSAVVVNGRTGAQESQQHLDDMNTIVDETDKNLRKAIEQAAIRHEQLDQLQIRSEEMLDKNENLVFGITNYRKTQERDRVWRRFQYIAFGAITIGVIILLIILSMTSKRPTSSSQILDIRYSNPDLGNKTIHDKKSNMAVSVSRRRRRRRRKIVI